MGISKPRHVPKSASFVGGKTNTIQDRYHFLRRSHHILVCCNHYVYFHPLISARASNISIFNTRRLRPPQSHSRSHSPSSWPWWSLCLSLPIWMPLVPFMLQPLRRDLATLTLLMGETLFLISDCVPPLPDIPTKMPFFRSPSFVPPQSHFIFR
jgi:hypothetical protein